MPSSLTYLLGAVLPPGVVTDDPGVLAAYGHDQAGTLAPGWPALLVRPTSTGEVSTVLQLASEYRTPVVARGAGSGLAGGANAVDGAIVVSTERMDSILETRADDQLVVVQPGVVNADLDAHLRPHGLWYPPDPASAAFSTIGGNIATNAGGLCCLKYGVTRDYVLALEVVLADGTTLRTGQRTAKGVAGYDMVSLFVGSEGTLGIVTEATLRVRPLRAHPLTLVASFDTLRDMGDLCATLAQDGTDLSMLELMDRHAIRAVEDAMHMGLDVKSAALLVAQCDLGDPNASDVLRQVEEQCTRHGASYVATAADAMESDLLATARRQVYPSLERIGATLLDDVAVPRSRLGDFLAEMECLALSTNLTLATFGHAGDGNMHPTIVYPHNDPDGKRAALDVFESIVDAALRLGGTVTGEHGVGTLKARHLIRDIEPAAMEMQRSIKGALDPQWIMNPGKVFT